MKAFFASKAEVDALPEALRALCKEAGGRFELEFPGGTPDGFVAAADLAAANGKLAEFRDNNIKLAKELDDLRPVKTELDTVKATFKDVDPAKYREAVDKLAKFEKKGVKDDDDITTQIRSAVDAAVKPITDQLMTVGAKLKESEERNAQQAIDLHKKEFEGQVTAEAIKAGIDEKMLPHFVRHTLDTYKYDGGSFIPKKGDTPIFSAKSPADPLSLGEFIEQQQQASPGFFKPSKGANTPPNGGGGDTAPAGRKPNAVALRNPSAVELGRHADKIASGDMYIVRDGTAA